MSSLEYQIATGDPEYITGYVPKVVNYSDATYSYTCLGKPGTSITDAKWQVFRTKLSNNNIEHVDYGRFSQVATSLAVVAAMTYV